MIRRLLAVVVLAAFTSACASAPVSQQQTVHRLALVSESYAVALQRLQSWEIGEHRAGRIGQADHVVWQRRIERFAHAGKAANDAIRASQLAGVQVQARAILDIVDELIAEQVIRFSDAQRITATLILESLRTAVMIWSATMSVDRLGSPDAFDRVLNEWRKAEESNLVAVTGSLGIAAQPLPVRAAFRVDGGAGRTRTSDVHRLGSQGYSLLLSPLSDRAEDGPGRGIRTHNLLSLSQAPLPVGLLPDAFEWCAALDSNQDCTVPQTVASAVGLAARGAGGWIRTSTEPAFETGASAVGLHRRDGRDGRNRTAAGARLQRAALPTELRPEVAEGGRIERRAFYAPLGFDASCPPLSGTFRYAVVQGSEFMAASVASRARTAQRVNARDSDRSRKEQYERLRQKAVTMTDSVAQEAA